MLRDAFDREVGFVVSAKRYLLEIEGLPSVRVHDVVVTEDGARAMVSALHENTVMAMALDSINARPGLRFEMQKSNKHVALGEHLLGRIVNALGDPLDKKAGFPPKNAPLVMAREALGLADRDAITTLLTSGCTVVDTVLPIAKGQRQLVMGPVGSGIDVFMRHVVHSQADQNMVMLYASIGRPTTYVRRMSEELLTGPTASRTIVLAATADDPTPQILLAPAFAFQIAEYFRDKGRDVLLVLDDLYTHAKYVREAALLEGRLPGRESYPGDMFYQQAQLIERAGCFKGKGSITLIPMLQTELESYTDLISTNVMGTTDGHLTFRAELAAQGIFPAVDIEASVTRVGKYGQTVVQRELGTAVLTLTEEAKAQEKYTQFGSRLSDAAAEVVRMGAILRKLLSQRATVYHPPYAQAIILALVLTTFSSGKDASFFAIHSEALFAAASTAPELEDLRALVQSGKSLTAFTAAVEQHSSFFDSVCRQ